MSRRGTGSLHARAAILLGLIGALVTGCGGGGHSGGAIFATNIPDGATSTVTASVASAPADGKSAIAITVTLVDSNGNPVDDAVVTATATGSGNTFLVSGLSSSSGVVTLSVTSITAGTETVTITAIGANGVPVTLAENVQVTFLPIAANNATSTISTSPTSVTANGTQAATVTVTVASDLGTPISGAGVTFSVASGTNVSLSSTAKQTTSSSGQATVNVTSTVAQTGVTIAALVSGVTTTFTLDSPSITFTPGPATHVAFVNMPAITAGIPFQLEVDFFDAENNLAPTNAEVVLANPSNPVLGLSEPSPGSYQLNAATNAALIGPVVSGTVAGMLKTTWDGDPSGQIQTIQLARSGRALFPGLIIATAGSYTVGAVATGFPDTTTGLTVSGGVAVGLSFIPGSLTGAPDNTSFSVSSVTGAEPFNPVIHVYATDGLGNRTTTIPGGIAGHQVTLSVTGGAFTLTGTTLVGTALATNDGWSFSGVGVPALGSGPVATTPYTLTAIDTPQGASPPGSLAAATSPTFKVLDPAVVNQATQVILTGLPTVGGTAVNLTAGSATGAPSITATLLDSLGNDAAAQNAITVTISVYDGQGNPLVPTTDYTPATLTITGGGTSSTATPLQINRVGTSFTVVATASDSDGSSTLVPLLGFQTTANPTTFAGASAYGASAPIASVVAGPAGNVAFTQNPGAGYGVGNLPYNVGVGARTSGGNQTVLPTIVVTAYDANGSANSGRGNVATSFQGTVTLTLVPPTNSTGVLAMNGQTGTLALNQVTATAVSGVATFAGVTIVDGGTATHQPTGQSYTLQASENSQSTGTLTLNVLAPGQPAALYFLNAIQTGQMGADSFLVSTTGGDIVVGVLDVNGTPLTNSATFATGITIALSDLGTGLGCPENFGAALDGLEISGTSNNVTASPVTGPGGTAVLDANTSEAFYGRYAEVGGSVMVSASVTSPGSYNLNNGASAAFDLWPGDPEYIDYSPIQDQSTIVTPQVPSGGSPGPTDSISPPGPSNPVVYTGTGGALVLAVEDYDGNLSSTASGTATATIISSTATLFSAGLETPVGLVGGAGVYNYNVSPYSRGIVLAVSGNTIVVSTTDASVWPTGTNYIWANYWSGPYDSGIDYPATTFGATVTSTSGLNVGDTVIAASGAQGILTAVNPGASTISGVIVGNGGQVTIPLGAFPSTGGFSVGDTVLEAGGAKAVIQTVNAGLSIVANVLPGAGIVLSNTVAVNVNVGDVLDESVNSGTAVVIQVISITSLEIEVTGGTWSNTSASFTDPGNLNVIGSVSFNSGNPTIVDSWPSGGTVIDAQNPSATGVFSGATSTQVLAWPTGSGTFADWGNGAPLTPGPASVAFTNGTSGSPTFGHLVGTTTVPIVSGVMVFTGLGITGQTIPGGGPWPYVLGLTLAGNALPYNAYSDGVGFFVK